MSMQTEHGNAARVWARHPGRTGHFAPEQVKHHLEIVRETNAGSGHTLVQGKAMMTSLKTVDGSRGELWL